MQKDQKNSGSRADKDSTLFLNGGRPHNPEVRDRHSGDIQAPGRQEDRSKPEGRGGPPVAARIGNFRQQRVFASPNRPPLASPRRRTCQKRQGCNIPDILQPTFDTVKDLLRKILKPLRPFARERARLRAAPKEPGKPFSLAPKTQAPNMVKRSSSPRPARQVASRETRSKPRIVVDTNVIMGGLINPSKASGRIIRIWLEGKVDVVVSPALLEEYLHIFNRMQFGPKEAVARRQEAMQKLLCHKNVALVQPEFRLEAVKEDPSDNRLIECAVSGRADFIISQDRHLLAIGEYSGIKILRAQAFLLQGYPEGRG